MIRLDDELEQLTLSVLDMFGEDAIIAAIRRATTTALQQKAQPIDLSSPVGASGVMSPDAIFTSMSPLLRFELRRLTATALSGPPNDNRRAGRTLACELRDDGEAGVEVQMFRDGEFLYGRRWAGRARALEEADERKAQYLSEGGELIE